MLRVSPYPSDGSRGAMRCCESAVQCGAQCTAVQCTVLHSTESAAAVLEFIDGRRGRGWSVPELLADSSLVSVLCK